VAISAALERERRLFIPGSEVLQVLWESLLSKDVRDHNRRDMEGLLNSDLE